MHDKYSNKPLLITNHSFHSIQFFRQRLNEIDEVLFLLRKGEVEKIYCRSVNV